MTGKARSEPAASPFEPDPLRVLELDMRTLETLRAIMAALRTPGTGCPWDLEQSFGTIAPYTIEEAYEVADAIARNDKDELCEELGDLLLQPVYHAQMAAEEGSFTLGDVVEAVNRKMIRRHPHVFGDEKARSAGAAKGFWERNKSKEKSEKDSRSALSGVALALPALMRANKLQAKAARVGFDWPHVEHVYDKIKEEVEEMKSAAEEERAGEFGDLLFAIVNMGRHYGIDAEEALRGANRKFERRFAFIESELAKLDKTPAHSDLAEMDALWDKAKAEGI
jgi:nucleoside triphosphate diphosphatase